MDKITTGKIKKFFKGKGFAGALCLSVVAIGISTYLTYDSTLKTIADEEPQKPDSTVSAEQVDNTQSGIPKDETSKSEADSSAAPANNFVRSTAKNIADKVSNGQLIVNVSKGIEESSLKALVEIIEEEIPQAKVAVLSGPSHAEEVGRGIPTTVVAGARDIEIAKTIQNAFMNDYFRVYTSTDVTGIELGGSVKNVIALAAGISDGLGLGDNTKAALMTRGMAEIMRLGLAMGADVKTLSGLSGMGDLIVTCTSKHSRNRNAGYLIGQGKTYEEAMAEVKMVVEGVYSAKATLALAREHGVEMPIVEAVNNVLFNGMTAKEALTELLNRDRKSELKSIIFYMFDIFR